MLWWALPSFLGTCISLYMSVYAIRRIPPPTGAYVTALSLSAAWWCAMQWAGLLWNNPDYRLMAAQLQYFAVVSAPALWLCVALAYSGQLRFLSRWYPVLWIMPAITMALVITNEFHQLVWQRFEVVPGQIGLIIEYGAWFRANAVYSYMCVVVGTILICFRIGLSSLYRQQFISALLAPMVVLGVNMPFIMGVNMLPIDPTPTGFVLAGLLLIMATRNRMFAAMPVARRLTMDNMSDGVIVIDNAGFIVDTNPAARDMFGQMRSSIGQHISQLTIDGTDLTADDVSDITLADGRCINVRMSTLITRGQVRNGQVILLRDVTSERDAQQKLVAAQKSLKELNAQLQVVAHTDELTGLANRRRLYEVLTEEWSRSFRHGRPMSVILFDFDHFKHVNDSHGHQTGDTVLRIASGVLSNITRPEDLLARHGGEEFAVLLPETSLDQAVEVAKKVHQAISALKYTGDSGSEFGVSISVGVASREASDMSQDNLIARADRAMYNTKGTGRNGVSVARGAVIERVTG